MMCHGGHQHDGDSKPRKVPWLLIVGLVAALGVAAGVLAVYGISMATLAIAAMFAIHPLLHLVGMRHKPSPGAQGPQPATQREDQTAESHHH